MAIGVTSIEKLPGFFVVYVAGSLDTGTYNVLEKKISYLMSEGAAKVITIDMKDVHYISSMGVRVIVKTKRDLERSGGTLIMMNLQPQIKKVFEIINALPSLRIFASLEELDDYLAEMQRRTVEGE